VAFNRETHRVLRPGGTVICITGTPVLCWFRLLRDYLLRLPIVLAAALVKETGVTHRQNVSDQAKALVPTGTVASGPVAGISHWYARLQHYLYSPQYNGLVLEELARNAGIGTDAALAAIHEHFRGSLLRRLCYYLTPQTHGQHYRNVWHEMSEWKLTRWRDTFTAAGFADLELLPYRFHHALEVTGSNALSAATYYYAAPLIQRWQGAIPTGLSSEFILVGRKPKLRPGAASRFIGRDASAPDTPR
jgi:hypothetical protein